MYRQNVKVDRRGSIAVLIRDTQPAGMKWLRLQGEHLLPTPANKSANTSHTGSHFSRYFKCRSLSGCRLHIPRFRLPQKSAHSRMGTDGFQPKAA